MKLLLAEVDTISLTAKTPDCGVGRVTVKSTLLLLVSPETLVIEFNILGEGAAPEPSY